MTIETERIKGIQSLRTLAFLGIFVSHLEIGPFGSLGAWGVSVFIIMSGFLLVYNYYYRNGIESIPSFLWKKIKKLYPLHIMMLIAALVISVYAIIVNCEYEKGVFLIKSCILNVLLIQTWIPNSDYYFSCNAVSWYLSICVVFYIAFPSILKRVKAYREKREAVICIVIVLLLQIVFSLLAGVYCNDIASEWFSKHWATYICPIYRLGDFIIGCNMGYLFLNRKDNRINSLYCSFFEIMTVALIVFSCIAFQEKIAVFGSENIKYTLLFIPSTVLIVWLFSIRKGIISRVLDNKVFRSMGIITPYAFLIHLMVIRYSNLLFPKIIGDLYDGVLKIMICFIITMLASIIYYKCINPLFIREKE